MSQERILATLNTVLTYRLEFIMPTDPLLAISPIDGRYEPRMQTLQPVMSEFGLIKYRTHTEIQWLIFLATENIIPLSLSTSALDTLRSIDTRFSLKNAQRIKTIEAFYQIESRNE